MYVNEFNQAIKADWAVVRLSLGELDSIFYDVVCRITGMEISTQEMYATVNLDPDSAAMGNVEYEIEHEEAFRFLKEKGFGDSVPMQTVGLVEAVFGMGAILEMDMVDLIEQNDDNPDVKVFIPFETYIKRVHDI